VAGTTGSAQGAGQSETGVRATLPATEPQPTRGGPSAPAQGGLPGIDIFAEQERSRENTDRENWDRTE
jgi:hypothetical protein